MLQNKALFNFFALFKVLVSFGSVKLVPPVGPLEVLFKRVDGDFVVLKEKVLFFLVLQFALMHEVVHINCLFKSQQQALGQSYQLHPLSPHGEVKLRGRIRAFERVNFLLSILKQVKRILLRNLLCEQRARHLAFLRQFVLAEKEVLVDQFHDLQKVLGIADPVNVDCQGVVLLLDRNDSDALHSVVGSLHGHFLRVLDYSSLVSVINQDQVLMEWRLDLFPLGWFVPALVLHYFVNLSGVLADTETGLALCQVHRLEKLH